MEKEVLSPKEAAQFLSVSVITLKRWEKHGLLKSIRINPRGDRRYTKEEIRRFLEERDNNHV